MNWSTYEIFTVLSGLVLLGAALLPGLSAKDRLRFGAGGVLFVGYGCFVASQETGTWHFPWVIFVLPFAGLGYAAFQAYGWWTKQASEEPRR